MKIGSWNVRGVNEPYKQREVRSLIRRNNLSMLGLNETKVHSSKHQNILHSICPSWRFLTNYNSHPNGRIWVMWDPSIMDIILLFSSDQVIHVQVVDIQNQASMMVSFLYGHNDYIPRRELWSALKSFSSANGTDPWLVLGDFNIVRHGGEKIGGDTSCPNYIEDLKICCYEAGLEDLKHSGKFLTWSKGSGQRYKARKLDRALVNIEWMSDTMLLKLIFLIQGCRITLQLLSKLA